MWGDMTRKRPLKSDLFRQAETPARRFFLAVDLLQGCAYNIERTITEEDIMDIKQLEQYLMQSDLGIDAKQLERFLSECDLDDKGFPPEELVSYIRRQIYDFKRLMAYYRCAIMEIET